MCSSTTWPLAPGVYALVPKAWIPKWRRTGRQTKPSCISIASSSSMWARISREELLKAGVVAERIEVGVPVEVLRGASSASSSFARRRCANAASLSPASASKQAAL